MRVVGILHLILSCSQFSNLVPTNYSTIGIIKTYIPKTLEYSKDKIPYLKLSNLNK